MFGFHRAFVKRLAAAPGRVNCDFNHMRVRLCGAQQDQTKHACFGKDRTAVRPVETRVTVLLREKRALRLSVKVRRQTAEQEAIRRPRHA